MTALSPNWTSEQTVPDPGFDIQRSRLLCIMNPISGQRGTASYVEAFRCVLAPEVLSLEIEETRRRGHGAELAQQGAALNRVILVVGGDGTFNEVGSALIATKTIIGLIPKGSGNGLACEWKIPLEPTAACRSLLNSKILTMDAGKLNNRYFFNIAGIGLDAQVAWTFDQHPTRGKLPYYYLTLKELAFHRMPRVSLRIDGRERWIKPLMIAFANGKQYGDGAEIAPKASMTDGLLHAVTIADMPLWKIIPQIPRLFNATIDQSPLIETAAIKEAAVSLPEPRPYHLDGEPFCDAREIKIAVIPKALNVLVPLSYNK